MIRALNNLLSNACRYARSQIDITLTTKNTTCLLTVEDDGPGIPTQDQQRLFQPFAQQENKARDNSCGHGLGLAIVQQIACWHKGEAKITDSALGGVKFTLSWPLTIN